MKHLEVPIAIFSLNTNSPILEEEVVKGLGLPYKALKGSYKGSTERSYMVVLSSKENQYATDMDKLARVKHLAWDYGQECILFSDNQRVSMLIYPNGKTVDVGKFVSASKESALLKDAWTYDFVNDQYYITKPLHEVK
jgi:hypothetical protein